MTGSTELGARDVARARTTGARRIRDAFAAANAEGRAAFIPYVVCGRPSIEQMPHLIASLVGAGADLVELGLPFSDPLVDGEVIRNATRAALDAGVTTASCLQAVRAIRAAGEDVPIVLMGSGNPVLRYGIDRFCADAAAAGVDGLILPDVPLAAGARLRAAAARAGIGMTYLVTPLTPTARFADLVEASSGFLYAVASTGTTGAETGAQAATHELLERAREAAGETPVAVGFGVSRAEHVAELAPWAAGVIVGSTLVDIVERSPEALVERVAELSAATRR